MGDIEKARGFFLHSVMNLIHLSLVAIIAITLLTIFFSFWITEKSDHDARAINISGSMRMQTYHIGLYLERDPSRAKQLTAKLDNTWQAPIFAVLRSEQARPSLRALYQAGWDNWQSRLFPALRQYLARNDGDLTLLLAELERQVALTDRLVAGLQSDAEAKLRLQRGLQLASLLLTVLVGSLIFYLLKNRVEAPLGQLARAAKAIGEGDFSQAPRLQGNDELALLSQSFQRMSDTINENYQELEQRVADRTEALQKHNVMLNFLFETARAALDSGNQEFDHQTVISRLGEILQQDTLELCLFTREGERPYLQFEAADPCQPCVTKSCNSCHATTPFDRADVVGLSHIYPIAHENTQYGVLRLQGQSSQPIAAWQDQLLRSTADQLALAMSLRETKEQENRLTLLNERTVIARELHDSLAQSLSYLQIQVTRLQKSCDQKKYAMQQPIIDELRDGLSSAYRHLRELLTTFRLKVDGEGLKGAIEQTVALCRERSDMHIHLDYALHNLPLNPKEEIHLLQITREACQNALNHSQGKHLQIHLLQLPDHEVVLEIEDDGIGLGEHPEKLNHYGLAIMQERARNLHGELNIETGQAGGTKLRLKFTPSYLREAA